MRVVVLYETNSGSTYLAAQQIQAVLNAQGHETDLVKARDAHVETVIEYNALVIGSPSWWVDNQEGQPHKAVTALLDQLREYNLHNKPIALFGTGDSSYAYFCQAVDVMEQFVSDVVADKVVDPLKIDEYYFHQERNNQLIREWAEELSERLNKIHIKPRMTSRKMHKQHHTKKKHITGINAGVGTALGAGAGAALGSIGIGIVLGLICGWFIGHRTAKKQGKK